MDVARGEPVGELDLGDGITRGDVGHLRLGDRGQRLTRLDGDLRRGRGGSTDGDAGVHEEGVDRSVTEVGHQALDALGRGQVDLDGVDVDVGRVGPEPGGRIVQSGVLGGHDHVVPGTGQLPGQLEAFDKAGQ